PVDAAHEEDIAPVVAYAVSSQYLGCFYPIGNRRKNGIDPIVTDADARRGHAIGLYDIPAGILGNGEYLFCPLHIDRDEHQVLDPVKRGKALRDVTKGEIVNGQNEFSPIERRGVIR